MNIKQSMIDVDVHKNEMILNLSEKRVSARHNRPMINDNDNMRIARTRRRPYTHGVERKKKASNQEHEMPRKIM